MIHPEGRNRSREDADLLDLDRRAGDLQPNQSLAADPMDRETSLGVGGDRATGRPDPARPEFTLQIFALDLVRSPGPDVAAAIQADRSSLLGFEDLLGTNRRAGHRPALEIDDASRDRRIAPGESDGQIARIDICVFVLEASTQPSPKPAAVATTWTVVHGVSCVVSTKSCLPTSIRNRPTASLVARTAGGAWP